MDLYWLMVSTPLQNISQLGSLFPIDGTIKFMVQTINQFCKHLPEGITPEIIRNHIDIYIYNNNTYIYIYMSIYIYICLYTSDPGNSHGFYPLWSLAGPSKELRPAPPKAALWPPISDPWATRQQGSTGAAGEIRLVTLRFYQTWQLDHWEIGVSRGNSPNEIVYFPAHHAWLHGA